MLELVFVIVIIGILAAVIIPRIERQPLREAAIQLVSDLRYTQHLAMVDDRYDITDVNWSRDRWVLIFENTPFTNNQESYTILSGNKIATNPQDTSKLLTGGSVSGIMYNSSVATPELNLGMKYGITNIGFAGCGVNGSIYFDHLGRPLTNRGLTPYPANSLLIGDCNITLFHSDGNVTVTISPETGYAYIRD